MLQFWTRVAGVFLLNCGACLASASAPRPNIVFFLADDMGWGDLGSNDHTLPSETPHLDKLAAGGITFTDMHAGSSVCSVSRAALLTGRMGVRTGVVINFSPSASHGLSQQERTLPQLLKEAAYDTYMVGKWHLGHAEGYLPHQRGFDSWLGIPYSWDMGCTDGTNGVDWFDNFCAADTYRLGCPLWWADPATRGGAQAGQPGVPLLADSDIVAQPVVLADLTSELDASAVAFLESHALTVPPPLASSPRPRPSSLPSSPVPSPSSVKDGNKSTQDVVGSFTTHPRGPLTHFPDSNAAAKTPLLLRGSLLSPPESAPTPPLSTPLAPFFLYYASPHLHAPQAYSSVFDNASTSGTAYGNALREMDNSIGVLSSALSSFGLTATTLFIFTSDNGPWNLKGNWRLAGSDCQGSDTGTSSSFFSSPSRSQLGSFSPPPWSPFAPSSPLPNADTVGGLAGSQGPYQGLWQTRGKNSAPASSSSSPPPSSSSSPFQGGDGNGNEGVGSKEGAGGGGGGGGTGKFTPWEGGHRVPAVMSWPGVLVTTEKRGAGKEELNTNDHNAFSSSSQLPTSLSALLLSHFDFVPTLAALAGVTLPTDRDFDGVDLGPLLFDFNQTNSTLPTSTTPPPSLPAASSPSSSSSSPSSSSPFLGHNQRRFHQPHLLDGVSDHNSKSHPRRSPSSPPSSSLPSDPLMHSALLAERLLAERLLAKRVLLIPGPPSSFGDTPPLTTAAIFAARVGPNMKVHFKTYGAAGCGEPYAEYKNPGNSTLVFDLSSDPGEANPLPLDGPAARTAVALATAVLARLNASLEAAVLFPESGHLQSVTNFSHGDVPGAWACASPNALACRLSA